MLEDKKPVSAGHQRMGWVLCSITHRPWEGLTQGWNNRKTPFLNSLPSVSFIFSLFLVLHFSSALYSQLSNIFDVEYVTCQLRHSGILEAIHIRKKGYPVRLPFQNFLARYSSVQAWVFPDTRSLDELVSTL